MHWASTISQEPKLEDAISQVVQDIIKQLEGMKPDLVVVFVSEHFRHVCDLIPGLIYEHLNPEVLIGCTAGGVIGGAQEVEHKPAISLTAAVLPFVTLSPFHCEESETPDIDDNIKNWADLVGITPGENPHFILLPDPFTFDPDKFVRGLDKAFPKAHKIGGLASGGRVPGSNALFMNREVFNSGLVGLGLSGNLEVDSIVAQGCRPIGSPMFVTKCQRNTIFELDGRPALDMINDLYDVLRPKDKDLFKNSLFLGIVMQEHQVDYKQGDFLIRNIIGMDEETGSISVGALFKENQVIQFHLRDAETSSHDLEALLSNYKAGLSSAKPQGSLLFSCLGRGQFLYGKPNHDSHALQEHLGKIAIGGFFCSGEIGPVHGKTFLHGYTSSFGIFKPRD